MHPVNMRLGKHWNSGMRIPQHKQTQTHTKLVYLLSAIKLPTRIQQIPLIYYKVAIVVVALSRFEANKILDTTEMTRVIQSLCSVKVTADP